MELTVVMATFDVHYLSNIVTRWRAYHTRLTRYFLIKAIVAENIKLAHLFFFGGEGIEDIYSLSIDTADGFDQVVAKITAYFDRTVVNACNTHDEPHGDSRVVQMSTDKVSKRHAQLSVDECLHSTPVISIDTSNVQHTANRLVKKPKLNPSFTQIVSHDSKREIITRDEFSTNMHARDESYTSVEVIISKGQHEILLSNDTSCKLSMVTSIEYTQDEDDIEPHKWVAPIKVVPRNVRPNKVRIDPTKKAD